MTDLSFTIKGIDGVLDRMIALPDKLQKQVGKKSARRAMVPVRNAARLAFKAFDDPGTKQSIWRNVYIQQSRRQSAAVGGVVMRVGILGGARQYASTKANVRKGRAGKSYATGGDKGNPGGDTWYWRFLELGTESIPARNPLRNSLERSAQSVAESLVANLNSELDQLAQKR